jgi:molecular chaperone GrpE
MSTNESEVVNNNAEENSSEQTGTENSTQNTENQSSTEQSWEEKYNEVNDKYLRLYSEFDNFRKRSIRERAELMKTAGEDIFSAFLPLLDDIERALKVNEQAADIKSVNEGLKIIHHKFSQSLKQKGLEPISAIGQTFNVDMHEAITNVPAPSEDQKGKVIDEVEKGYTLNGKVIRFSKVVVGA